MNDFVVGFKGVVVVVAIASLGKAVVFLTFAVDKSTCFGVVAFFEGFLLQEVGLVDLRCVGVGLLLGLLLVCLFSNSSKSSMLFFLVVELLWADLVVIFAVGRLDKGLFVVVLGDFVAFVFLGFVGSIGGTSVAKVVVVGEE